jgi:hypothetical protein
MKIKTRFKVIKYDKNGKHLETLKGEDNIILNEGATALWNLFIGNSEIIPFNEDNSFLGVGDGTADENQNQTGLQGTNKAFKPMDAGYPTISGRIITYQATFGENDANFTWNEWTLVNGPNDDFINFNRKKVYMGVKSGGTWILQVSFEIL